VTLSKAVLLPRGDPSRHAPATIPGGSPVSLAPVANRPLIAHALDCLSQTGVRSAAVVVDATIERDVRRAVPGALDADDAQDLDVVYVDEGSGGSLATSLAAVADFVGDEPFALHLCDSACRGGLSALLPAAQLGRLDALIVTYDGGPGVSDTLTDLAAQRLTAAGCPRPCGVPAGVYVFGPGIFEAVDGAHGHSGRELEIIASIGRMSDLGGRVEVRSAHDWWRYDRRADALLDGNRFALERLAADVNGAHLSDVRIQGSAVIHPTARIESSMVRGPAAIGPGAHITESYIGPYTSIGEDVVIEGAEVENSIIFPGASLKHLGSRLEASIVGPQAKVGRDFRLPKALRLTIGERAEISLT
jgi:glucose-1-phosphate thymidylyltransferase